MSEDKTHYNVFIVLETDDPNAWEGAQQQWHAVETTTRKRDANQIVSRLRKRAKEVVGHNPQVLDQ